MQLMGKQIMHNIVVRENLQDNIIGINYINKHFLGYRAYRKSPVWETPLIESGGLKTTERVYLYALSSKIVKFKCQDKEGKPFGQNTLMIATIDSPHTLVTGPPSLVKLNKEGVALMVLQNCAPFGIWIEQDTGIRFADQMNNQNKVEKIDYEFIYCNNQTSENQLDQ